MKNIKRIIKLLLLKPRIHGSCTVTNNLGKSYSIDELFSFTDIIRKKSYFVYLCFLQGKEEMRAGIYEKGIKNSSLININNISEWNMIKERYSKIQSREITDVYHTNHIGRKYMMLVSLAVSILLMVLYVFILNMMVYLPILSFSRYLLSAYAVILSVQIVGTILLSFLTDDLNLSVKSGIANAVFPVNIFVVIHSMCTGMYSWYILLFIFFGYLMILVPEVLEAFSIKCVNKSSYFYRARYGVSKANLFCANALFLYNMFLISLIYI